MQNRYAVIGLGRFGSSVARVLSDMGQYVIAIDSDQNRVNELGACLSRVICADATDPAAVRALHLSGFDAIVAISGNMEANIITCLNCREAGVRTLVAKAQDERHGRVLERIGVDRIVYPQRDMGARVAHNISAGGIIDYVRLSERFGMAELIAPELMAGQSLKQLNLSNTLGVNVMAIKRGKGVIVSPGATERVARGDVLVVIGDTDGINRIQGD